MWSTWELSLSSLYYAYIGHDGFLQIFPLREWHYSYIQEVLSCCSFQRKPTIRLPANGFPPHCLLVVNMNFLGMICLLWTHGHKWFHLEQETQAVSACMPPFRGIEVQKWSEKSRIIISCKSDYCQLAVYLSVLFFCINIFTLGHAFMRTADLYLLGKRYRFQY